MKYILSLTVFIILSFVCFAQQDTEQCPFGGRENCTGYCGLFTDGNKDGYCDYSLLNLPKENKKEEPEKKTAVEPKEVKKDSVKNSDTPVSDREYGNPTFDSLQSVSPTIEEAEEEEVAETTKAKTPYHFWPLIILTLGLYTCTFFCVKTGNMKKITHRKIWNSILLLTCLVSCLLGLYIVLAKMYGWSMNYMTILQFHVDFGIAMTVIAIIHIIWHWKYFKNMVKSKQKE